MSFHQFFLSAGSQFPVYTPPPEDQQLAQRIIKLAEFAARNGPQFVEVIKIKQVNNPDYQFLYSQDSSNDFFRWVLFCTVNNVDYKDPIAGAQIAQQQAEQQQQQPGSMPQNQQQVQQTYMNAADQQQLAEEMLPPDKRYPLLEEVSSGFKQVLDALVGSKESIKQSQNWFIQVASQDYHQSYGMVKMMLDLIKESSFDKQTHVIYLANDILFKCLQNKKSEPESQLNEVPQTFQQYLDEMFVACALNVKEDTEKFNKLKKILDFWGQRDVFDKQYIEKIQECLQEPELYQEKKSREKELQKQQQIQLQQQQDQLAQQQQQQQNGFIQQQQQQYTQQQMYSQPLPGSYDMQQSGQMQYSQPQQFSNYQGQQFGYNQMPIDQNGYPQQQFIQQGQDFNYGYNQNAMQYGSVPQDQFNMQGQQYQMQPQFQAQQYGYQNPNYGSYGYDPNQQIAFQNQQPYQEANIPYQQQQQQQNFQGPPNQLPSAQTQFQNQSQDVSQAFSFPPGLIPQLVREKLIVDEPYTPLNSIEIQQAGVPSAPEMDAYLKARVDKFYSEIKEKRQGMTRADFEDKKEGVERAEARKKKRSALREKEVDHETGMMADGSYAGPKRERGERSAYKGLGAARKDDETYNLQPGDDAFQMYRKMRSGAYHSSMGKGQSNMAKGGK